MTRAADWLEVADARSRILGDMRQLPARELPLLDALGHVLAEEVVAPVDLPLWDNSAMDGFAVRAVDVAGASAAAPARLRVVEDLPAGSHPSREIGPGEAARVMTGAPVPAGADSVIRVEHTDGGTAVGSPNGWVQVLSPADAGRNIRRRAEDVRKSEVVLNPGRVLRPAELGVAASLGRSRLRAVGRPVVAILASGDELVDVDRFDEVVAGRRIVSSNSYALAAQVREAGAEPRVLGIAHDTPESIRMHLEASRGCDVLITSAGVAVGEHDYMLSVLEGLGLELAFWRVNMRPGSPFAFGRVDGLGGVPWFGLPGNPVSSMVVFEVFVRPALLRMSGHSAIFAPTVPARPTGDSRPLPDRDEFLRVRLSENGSGEYEASLTGGQGSGMLTSMARADALLVVPAEASRRRSDGMFSAILLGGSPLRSTPGY
jgi:molybdopterin molybdotransferase